MRILLTGATGFIGAALAAKLELRGHQLRLAVRNVGAARARWPRADIVAADLARATTLGDWLSLLGGVDAVVNAVGILRESKSQPFERVHLAAPIALFRAAVLAGVARVIQISALGADADARSAYHLSKRGADEALAALPLHSSIVQPSLVFGLGGASAAWFERLALMTPMLVPKSAARVQPIHIDDLTDALAALLECEQMPRRLAAVGPRCVTPAEYLAALRAGLGASPTRVVHVPRAMMSFAAYVGDRLRRLPFDSEAYAMLERGNCADVAPIADLLGRVPRDVDRFIAPEAAHAHATLARVSTASALLRVAVALVWIVSGAVSLGLWPIDDSLALLARCGITGWPALAALFGSAALDIAFGLGTLFLRRRRFLYGAQIALVLAYTATIAICLPAFLLHPFAPIVKNAVMLSAIWLLRETERR